MVSYYHRQSAKVDNMEQASVMRVNNDASFNISIESILNL